MKKIILVICLCFLSVPSFAAFYGPYAVTSPTATDGDTIRGDVQIWPNLVSDVAIRVRGVDTPEIFTPKCPEEKTLGLAAKDFVDKWLSENSPITISVVAPDKYAGRFDAVVTGVGGSILANELIKAGYGRPYSGGKRQPWCQ